MSLLREALSSGEFVVTGEVAPPRGVDIEEVKKEAEPLRGHVAAVNVTDNQSSNMRLGSLAACVKLVGWGFEPVFQVTCRDRNRLALQSDLLSAYALGIRNVLILTGDHVALGDHKDAKAVFDLDSVLLLQALSTLEAGQDMAGNELKGSPRFLKGAIVTPCAEPVEPQIIKLEKKVAAGAEFIQTQAVYDPAAFEAFMKQIAHIKVPVMVGIVPLYSAGMAKFMNANIAGISIPQALIDELNVPKEERPKKAVEIAGRLIKEMKGMCQGVHLMPQGRTHFVPDILAAAGL